MFRLVFSLVKEELTEDDQNKQICQRYHVVVKRVGMQAGTQTRMGRKKTREMTDTGISSGMMT